MTSNKNEASELIGPALSFIAGMATGVLEDLLTTKAEAPDETPRETSDDVRRLEGQIAELKTINERQYQSIGTLSKIVGLDPDSTLEDLENIVRAIVRNATRPSAPGSVDPEILAQMIFDEVTPDYISWQRISAEGQDLYREAARKVQNYIRTER
ncbi:hypothetical protein SEA_JONJAMES_103 [Gordonia Phage JonJames]|nr:hypothetical protein SEA_JONJAMES_103 [Gordonia Phage JonJames]